VTAARAVILAARVEVEGRGASAIALIWLVRLLESLVAWYGYGVPALPSGLLDQSCVKNHISHTQRKCSDPPWEFDVW
jgi:hypothetical protein